MSDELELTVIVDEYNILEERQQELLGHLYDAVAAGPPPRNVKFENGKTWHGIGPNANTHKEQYTRPMGRAIISVNQV
jgi:hypothetical protein